MRLKKRTLILALIIAANSSYAKEYYFEKETEGEEKNTEIKKILEEWKDKSFLAKELKEKIKEMKPDSSMEVITEGDKLYIRTKEKPEEKILVGKRSETYQLEKGEAPDYRVAHDAEHQDDPIERGGYEGALRIVDQENRQNGISNRYFNAEDKMEKTFDNVNFVPVAQYVNNGEQGMFSSDSIKTNKNPMSGYHSFEEWEKLTKNPEKMKKFIEENRDKFSSVRKSNQKRFFFGNGNTVKDIIMTGKENFDKKMQEKENMQYTFTGTYQNIDNTKKNQLDISMKDFKEKIEGKSREEVAKFLKTKLEEKQKSDTGNEKIKDKKFEIKDGDLYTVEGDKSWKVYWTLEPVTVLAETMSEKLKDEVFSKIYVYHEKKEGKDSAGRILYTKDGSILVEDTLDYNKDMIDVGTLSLGTVSKHKGLEEYLKEKKEKKVEEKSSLQEEMKKFSEEMKEALDKKSKLEEEKEKCEKKCEAKIMPEPKDNGGQDIDWSKLDDTMSEEKIDQEYPNLNQEGKDYLKAYVAKKKVEKELTTLEEKITKRKNEMKDKYEKSGIDDKLIIVNNLGKNVEFRGRGTILGTVDLGEGYNELSIGGNLTGRYGTNIIMGADSSFKGIKKVSLGQDIDDDKFNEGAVSGTASLTLDIDPTIKNSQGHLTKHLLHNTQDKNILFLKYGSYGLEPNSYPDDFNMQMMLSRIGENGVIDMGRKLSHQVLDTKNGVHRTLHINMTSDSIAHHLYQEKTEENSENKDKNTLLKVEVKDKIKRLSEEENDVYGSIVNSKRLGILHPTLTNTNKKISFSYKYGMNYEDKNLKLVQAIKDGKNLEEILEHNSEFHLNEEQKEKAKKYLEDIQDKKNKDLKYVHEKMETNKKEVQQTKEELEKKQKEEKEISDKIQKMEEELKKLPEMRSSEEYKKLNPNQKLEKALQEMDFSDMHKQLDSVSNHKNFNQEKENHPCYQKLKTFKEALDNSALEEWKKKYPDSPLIKELDEKIKGFNFDFGQYTNCTESKWTRNYCAKYLKQGEAKAEEIDAILKQLTNEEKYKEKIEKEKKETLEPKQKEVAEKKTLLENKEKTMEEETETALYAKKYLKRNKDYQKLRNLLYYTLREEEALSELKEMISQMKDTNIYSKVNKIAKNELSTYTNLPFDKNRSLSKKTQYARGGFISARTVQNNFKGNIYTAYGLYEKQLDKNSYLGVMFGGANTNHTLTHNKRSAKTTPTNSTVKGVSLYTGAYYGKKLYEELDWISGMGVQYGNYKVERHLKNNYQGLDSNGKVKVGAWTTYSGLVLHYPLQEDVEVQLKGILSYSYLNQGKIKESNGLNLDIQSKDYHYLDSELGVSLNKTLYDFGVKSNLSAGISAISGLAGYKNKDLKAKIHGSTSSFNIKGDKTKKDAVKLFMDYNVQMDAGFNYGLEGTYISNQDESNVKIGIKAGYSF